MIWLVLTDTLKRVKQAAMPKPDKWLQSRPLKEVESALLKLKRVVLFHPDSVAIVNVMNEYE